MLEKPGLLPENLLSDKEFAHSLKSAINELILKDFNRLISILYRLDISEGKLKSLLQQHKDTDAADIIRDLIIERQLQKIKSRREYKERDNPIDENEKW